MRIQRIISQHRRNFTAVYECEHCGHTYEGSGYDDANFYENVVPDKARPKCNRKAGDDYRALTTRHPAGQQL